MKMSPATKDDRLLVGLAGHQNAGKSTAFNVVDASSLKRSLYFSFQIMEMGFPVVVAEGLGADSPLLKTAQRIRDGFEEDHYMTVADYMVGCRDRLATSIIESCVRETRDGRDTITDMIDMVVLNRFAAPFFLIGTGFVIYQLSIVKGHDLTQYWWPILARLRAFGAGILPDAGMLQDPYVRAMGLWMVDSANALLNYVPIFLILFALIAIFEDSGYMARIAFILDKLFHSFGLHGQSTLPYRPSPSSWPCSLPGS
jgi:ferrous iron transport protein B